VHLDKYYWVDELKDDEMGGACGMYEGEEKLIF
jgi:hypothetical protein